MLPDSIDTVNQRAQLEFQLTTHNELVRVHSQWNKMPIGNH